jgi:hypothetical protein
VAAISSDTMNARIDGDSTAESLRRRDCGLSSRDAARPNQARAALGPFFSISRWVR